MSDINFEQALAAYNQEYKEAEEFGADWYPDDGEYIATVVGVKKGVSTKDGKQTVWWKVTGRLEDPGNVAIHGKEFPVGYYSSKALGILKGQVKALNNGQVPESLAEVNNILAASEGKVLKVKIATSSKEKNGATQEFTNCYIQEVLAVQDVADASEVPPQAGEAPPLAN